MAVSSCQVVMKEVVEKEILIQATFKTGKMKTFVMISFFFSIAQKDPTTPHITEHQNGFKTTNITNA